MGPTRWSLAIAIMVVVTMSLPVGFANNSRMEAGIGDPVTESVIVQESSSTPASSRKAGYIDFQVLWQWNPPGGQVAWAVGWSADASKVAVGTDRSGNRSLFILNAGNGSLIKSIDTSEATYGVHFSPNGSFLAAGGNNFGTRVYETTNWTQVIQLEPGSDVNDVSWSPDGRYLTFSGPQAGGFNGRFSTFDATATFAPVGSLSRSYGGRPVLAVDWSSDSARLAVGLENVNGQEGFIYDRATGQEIREFNCFSNCRQVRYGPDPRYLALGREGQRFSSNEVDVWIWDTTQNYTGGGSIPILSDYRSHPNDQAMSGVAYSPLGDAVASGGGNQNDVDLWWSSNGSFIKSLGSGQVRELRFSPSGDALAAAEQGPNRVTVWGDQSAPAVVSVEIAAPDRAGLPYTPDYLKAERATFKVTFTEDLDQAFLPNVTFGRLSPYKSHVVNSTGFTSPRIWEGWFDFSAAMANGENRIVISGARDSGGNVMAPDTNKTFLLDTFVPTFSISPPAMYWRATTTLNLSVNASDPDATNSSELAFVRPSVRWNNDLNASWGNWSTNAPVNLSGTSFSGMLPFAFSSGEGHYEYAFAVYDRSMNSPAGFVNATAGHDMSGPSANILFTGGYWSKNGTHQLHWDVQDTVELGRVRLFGRWGTDNVTWNQTQDGWGNLSGKSYNYDNILSGLSDHHFQVGLEVFDASGISKNTGYMAKGGFDRTPPISTLLALPSITNQQVLIINYTATDSLSGIARVQLEHRKDGGNWGACCPESKTLGQFAFDTTLFGGDGLYEFRARAWDNATNGETPKTANETWTLVDTVAPKLLTVFPTHGLTNVPISVHPRIAISEPVTGTVRLVFGTTPVDATLTWSNGTSAVISPTSPLQGGLEYRIEIDVVDRAGNHLTASTRFTTSDQPDTTPPKVSATVPGPFALVNALDTVKIVFDEAMDASTLDAAGIAPLAVDSPTLSFDLKTLTFKVVPATIETTYVVTISAAKAKDLAGNPLDGNGDGTGGDDFVFEFFYSASAPANLEVSVKDEAARPIVGANVSLERSGRTIGPVLSDAGGQSVFSSLSPGQYTLSVKKSGYQSHSAPLSLASGPNSVQVTLIRPTQQVTIDPFLLLLLLIVIIVSALFIMLQRRRNCPRCSAQRGFGQKECRKCGYPREMPKLFEGATVEAAKPHEPAPSAAARLPVEKPLPPPPPDDEEPARSEPRVATPPPAVRKPSEPRPAPKPASGKPTPKSPSQAKSAAKKEFDPYKPALLTSTNDGIKESEEVLGPESEEERRKRAIEGARAKASKTADFEE